MRANVTSPPRIVFALAGEPGAQRIGESADGSDHHDAQRQARDKDAEAFEAAAQLAEPRRKIVMSRVRGVAERRLEPVAIVTTTPYERAPWLSSATIEPSDMRITRSVIAASRSSWVTMTSVALRR